MRLIDADAAKRKIAEETIAHFSELDAGTFAIMTAVANMFDSEGDFPTVEAEPVRYSKWLFGGDNAIECSVCRETYFTRGLLPRNYCPNCGAKMEE